MKNVARAILFSVALTVGPLLAQAAPRSIDHVEASVNGSLILKSDVIKFRELMPLRAQVDALFANTPIASKGEKASDSEIVDFLISQKLILQQFPIPDSEVEQEINGIQTQNRMDRAGLKGLLSQQGYKFEDYFELIRISAAEKTLVDRDIRTKVYISDDEVKNYFYNRYAKSTSADIEYRLQLVTITVKNYKNAAAAKEIAQRALKSLKSGELFEEVAKRYSDDANAQAGGELGTLSEGQLSPQIRENVKKLKIGQYSDVFGSAGSAFYIVKLVDLKSSDTERFEKLKEEIRGQLAASEYQHQISLWLERQRQNAFIHKVGEPAITGLPISNK